MKKKSIFQFLLGTVALAVGLTSCKKCQTCTYAGYSEEVCEEEFASNKLYKAYINYLEAYGYKCK